MLKIAQQHIPTNILQLANHGVPPPNASPSSVNRDPDWPSVFIDLDNWTSDTNSPSNNEPQSRSSSSHRQRTTTSPTPPIIDLLDGLTSPQHEAVLSQVGRASPSKPHPCNALFGFDSGTSYVILRPTISTPAILRHPELGIQTAQGSILDNSNPFFGINRGAYNRRGNIVLIQWFHPRAQPGKLYAHSKTEIQAFAISNMSSLNYPLNRDDEHRFAAIHLPTRFHPVHSIRQGRGIHG